MAGAIVQSKETASSTSGTTVVSPSITVSAGNSLAVYTLGDVDTTHTISDGLGGLTWTQQASCVNTGIPTRTRLNTAPCPAGGTGTVTCTFGVNQTSNRCIIVYEISGTSGPDAASGLADTGNSPTSPKISATPTSQPGLAIAWCSDVQGNTAPGTDTGDGFASFGNFWVGVRDGTASTKSFSALTAISSNFPNTGFDHVNQLLILFTDGSLGPNVTGVSPSSFDDATAGIVVSGAGFGASQGAGSVIISPTNNVADAGAITQTVTAWGDTSITITSVKSTLSYGTNYLFVKDNSGASNASGFQVQFFQTRIGWIKA